ncbi:hypothetical protein [Komagataeibacter saccharivorans]|uniref:hypothetical protein n=1 Tax=Komagataeibacter saccharivorans TaxID=265959 RepID=UPI0039E92F6E
MLVLPARCYPRSGLAVLYRKGFPAGGFGLAGFYFCYFDKDVFYFIAAGMPNASYQLPPGR